MINGAYTRGKFAQQQILNAAFPPPDKDHDKIIDEALALFRDKALDDADPDRLKSIVTAWPLAQEVRKFVEDQMLFLIHLVVNNGIDTILRRITSDDSPEPNIGILCKQDRHSGVIPLPRSALHPTVGPGNIIAEDNEPKVVELNEDDSEAREREIAALKVEAEAQEAARKEAKKVAQKAAQKEKKTRLKANRRARLEAEVAVKKTEEDRRQQESTDFSVAKHMELTHKFKVDYEKQQESDFNVAKKTDFADKIEVDNKKQQEAARFDLVKKLELVEKFKFDNFGPSQHVGTYEKPKLADGSDLTFAEATTSPRKDNNSMKAIHAMGSPTQKANKEVKAQKKAELKRNQGEVKDFELVKHLKFGGQQKIAQEVGITEPELKLQQQEDMESSPKTKQIAEGQWERVTKDVKVEKKPGAQRKQILVKEADNAGLAKEAVRMKQKDMAKTEELEKKGVSIQEKARLKVAKDAEADRNCKLANQQQVSPPVHNPKSDKKVNTPQPAKKPAPARMNDETVGIPQPGKKSWGPTDILKNDENVNTLQLAKEISSPKEIVKGPQEGKLAAPLGNAFSDLHIEYLAATSDRSGKERKAAPTTKATTLEPALKVKSTAEFPFLDGSTTPSRPSTFAVPGSALAWSKPAITGVPTTSVPPAVEKAHTFPALDDSITLIKPSAMVVAGVGNSSFWSDAVVRVAPTTSAPARVEKPHDFPDLDGSIATIKSSANDVAAIGSSSLWSKTAAGGVAPSSVRNSVESTKEFPALKVSTTPIKALADAVTGTGGALSWSKVASPAASATPSSAIEKPRRISALHIGSAGTESSAKAVAREKPSDLVIFWKSKNSVRLDRTEKSRYACSACKEKFGDFFALLEHLKSEQSHRDLEVKLVYDPDGERVVIWTNKPPAAHDPKATKLFSEEVAPHNKSPLAITKADKKAAASTLPGLDAGTIATEVPAEIISRKKNVPLSPFSKPETTSATPMVTSTVSLPRLKRIRKDSHTSGASKLTFGSFETERQAPGTTVVDESDAKDDKTVAKPDAEILGLDATASSMALDAGTTVNLPTVPVAESPPLVVTKSRAEAGKMKRRDSINFIRTRTDSRAAQLGSPLGPAGQTPSTPPTPLALGDAVVYAPGTTINEKAFTSVPEWRKQAPVVVSKQSEVQEQQADVKGKGAGKPGYQCPAFQFPGSFGDISINEPTGVDRSQKPKTTPATPAALKPSSSAKAAIAADKRPVFQTATAQELERMRVMSLCFACGRHGHAQNDCPSFIETTTGIVAVSNVVTSRYAVDGSAPQSLAAIATDEDYARMSERGLCYVCGHPGHAEISCPFFNDISLTVLRAAAESNVGRETAIVASSTGRHEVNDFHPLAQTLIAEQVSGMRARDQYLACGCRGHKEAGCPYSRASGAAATAEPAISHNSEVVVNRKVGPPIKIAVRDTTAAATADVPVVRTSTPAVSHDTVLANRVTAPPVKVAALGVGHTLNELQIEDRSAFLERMAALIRNRVPAGQPGGEVINLGIPKKNGGVEIMTMVLPERRVFKHKRSKSVGDKLDKDVSYYTQQEQEHFLRREFLECKHTPGTQKGEEGYCSVHNGEDPVPYCELDDADDLANGEPSVHRNSVSLPHLEGNPYKLPDGSGAFVRTHKRAPAALVSRIENPASLAPVTKNVHVFCAGIGM